MLWFLFVQLACSPALRFPGPLGGLGDKPGLDAAMAPGPEKAGPTRAPARSPARGDADSLVEAARSFVGRTSLVVEADEAPEGRETRTFRYDCSGLVEAVMYRAGGDYAGSSADMFERAKDEGTLSHRRKLRPGDLVFFDNTYDRNRNGRRDDPLSHIAIVEAVDRDGTATLIHLGSTGVVRIRMNLREPDVNRAEDGRILNDYLRARRSGDSPRTRYLTGELWAGSATPALSGARISADERAASAVAAAGSP